MRINVNQIDQQQLSLAIQQASSGSAFSGNFVSYVIANGFMGNNVVSTTGGAQIVLGAKSFISAVGLPYGFAGTGDAVARIYIDTLNAATSGALASSLGAISGILESGNSAFTVTGSSVVNQVNITGLGGTQVIWSGDQLFISGGAGGGGGSSTLKVTGSSSIATPNFTGVGAVVVSYDGTYVRVSGAATTSTFTGLGTGYSGYAEDTFVHRGLNTETISGVKTFTGALTVGVPSLTGHAVTLGYLSGVTGALGNNLLVVSGILNATITGVSGVLASLGGGTTNNFYITGTGTNNIFTSGNSNFVSLSGTNNINPIFLNGITGNFVNMSFYFDEFNLNTGLNQIEAFIGRSFFFTGYAIGVINSGTAGILSGNMYQRTPVNTKTTFNTFSLRSGNLFYASGGLLQVISGMNRVGLDIITIGTGVTGLSIGLFGVGY